MPSKPKFHVDAAPHIIAPDGQRVPIYVVERLSRDRMALPHGVGPPDWRDDPSYFWADEVKRKRERR